jgi:hypothetical protein
VHDITQRVQGIMDVIYFVTGDSQVNQSVSRCCCPALLRLVCKQNLAISGTTVIGNRSEPGSSGGNTHWRNTHRAQQLTKVVTAASTCSRMAALRRSALTTNWRWA